MEQMPFRVPLNAQVSSLSAGEKQKLEILKLLYLDQRFMILDEPTSVLTPGEADEMLGLLGGMADAQGNHRADDLAQVPRGEGVLRPLHRAAARQVHRRGRRQDGERSRNERDDDRRHDHPRTRGAQEAQRRASDVLELAGLFADDNDGMPAIKSVNLKVKAGEIVGIAGVSGNGQSALVEALSGQRPLSPMAASSSAASGSNPSAATTTSSRCSGCPRSR